MRIAIIYRSILGSTKKYAKWLQEETKGDLLTFKEAHAATLADYDVIVVASGTYAAQMPCLGFLKEHWNVLKDKKVIAIAVGMAPADDPQSKISYDLIPDEIKKGITYFKLPGKLFKAGAAGKPSKEKLAPVLAKIREIAA